MDFLDLIDLETKVKKSHRVRSWYLYEQYKSLERNQIDAAKKLKDRSYQERILRQELQERKSRRKLYDQLDLSCKSESRVQSRTSDGDKATISASSDDFFESFCELQDVKSNKDSEADSSMDETFSLDDSQIGKRYLEEYKTFDDIKDDQSYAESVNSVVENNKSNADLAADLTEKLSIIQKNIEDRLEQESASSFEKFKSQNEINSSEVDNSCSIEELDVSELTKLQNNQENDINIQNIWSRLVSFAYQVIQLNHGNCYYDYGSQFLTAVLACDVLRRGVNCMCHILQPYVSPIKFATDISDNDDSTSSYKSARRKRLPKRKKIRNKEKVKQRRFNSSYCKAHTHYSDEYWSKLSKYTFGYKSKKRYRASEPCPSIDKFSSYYTDPNGSSSSIWPSVSKRMSVTACPCSCHERVVNPMLKIGQYIDRLLKDIDDCQQ